MPHTSYSLFLKQWLCHVRQHNWILLSLVLLAAILNWGHTHYNWSYMNPMKVNITYNLYNFTPQSEGSTNTLTNWICTPCFYKTACLNTVTNFSSVPATRLKQWVANKSDTLFCHVAHVSDTTHANKFLT